MLHLCKFDFVFDSVTKIVGMQSNKKTLKLKEIE